LGWGSTVEAGPKPYRHVPVRIVSPGNVESVCGNVFLLIIYLTILKTGDDTETLRKVEARIRADFKNSLPPHLQPNAKSLKYVSGSEQSRIFVASHSVFAGLDSKEVQKILRDRIILVHGNPLDYKYGWNLESFGRLHDVDKKISVQGKVRSTLLNIFF
jgi:hypothetical protein